MHFAGKTRGAKQSARPAAELQKEGREAAKQLVVGMPRFTVVDEARDEVITSDAFENERDYWLALGQRMEDVPRLKEAVERVAQLRRYVDSLAEAVADLSSITDLRVCSLMVEELLDTDLADVPQPIQERGVREVVGYRVSQRAMRVLPKLIEKLHGRKAGEVLELIRERDPWLAEHIDSSSLRGTILRHLGAGEAKYRATSKEAGERSRSLARGVAISLGAAVADMQASTFERLILSPKLPRGKKRRRRRPASE